MPAVIIPPMFGTPPGWVGAVGFDQSMPVRIAIGGGTENEMPSLSPAIFFAIITGATIQGESRIAVSQSLNDVIRMYLFGESPHIIRIEGLAFPRLCGGVDSLTGAERVFWFYENGRASSYRFPIRISFGDSMNFAGMLVGVGIDWNDSQFGVAKFTLTVMAFPRVQRRNRFLVAVPGKGKTKPPPKPIKTKYILPVDEPETDTVIV